LFKTRFISAVILVALALALIIPGGTITLVSMGIVSLIGMYELYRIVGIEKSMAGYVGFALAILFYLNLYFQFFHDDMTFVIVAIGGLMSVYVFTYPKYKTEQIVIAFFGIFYVAMMLSYVYQTRMLNNGVFLVWLIFLCSWGADTCAYIFGKLFGKHKMSPKLSPKKSIEGAIGGVAGAMFFCFLFLNVFKKYMTFDSRERVIIIVIGGICALVSMVGDLAASAIKRNYDIKDYGTLIPGHGGILDRFDSVIFIAPIVYTLIYYAVATVK